MPVAYKEGSVFSMQNIMAMITGGESVKSNVKNALLNIFSGSMEKVTGAADVSIAKRVEGALGEVEMPAYRKEWNFEPMATKLEVGPFPYPQSLADAAAKEQATGEGLNDDKVESDPRAVEEGAELLSAQAVQLLCGRVGALFPCGIQRFGSESAAGEFVKRSPQLHRRKLNAPSFISH